MNLRQRVVVLGANGFVGRRVLAALAAADWAIPIAAGHRAAAPVAGGEYIQVDATDEAALRRAFAGAAGVVNCVSGDARTIVESSRAVLGAAAATAAAPRVVHMSSIAAYGSVSGVVDESAPLLGDLGPYSAAKAEAESLAAQAQNTVVFRPGIIYGPHSTRWSDELARLLVARRIGDLGNNGGGYCNLVHVDDVVAAIISALRLPGTAGQAFNLAAPQPPTWNEYFARYAAALGAAPVRSMSQLRLGLELAAVAPALRIVELSARMLRLSQVNATPVLRPSLIKLCRHAIILDSQKATRILELRWTPLEQGLKSTAAWFAASR